MDLPTVQALLGILTLVSLVLGALLTAMHRRVSDLDRELSDHRIEVAQNYVTKDDHDRRVTAEIESVKDLLYRVELGLKDLLEISKKDSA